MRININRLMQDIEKYANIGMDETGGVTRPSFSQADHEVRRLFENELIEIGLQVTIDGAANIWGRVKGTGKKNGCIVIGSHLDSVPNGGKLDGPLGVLTAKEVIKTLIENRVILDHDLEIVSFTAEESNDFQLSTFGSRAFTGKLRTEVLENAQDSNGNVLRNELLKVGGSLDQFPLMKECHKEKKAFIELHIEQGQRLESQNISVAIVDRMVGMYRSIVRIKGQSNHSGTTMMEHRRDALTAASEMILMIEHICQMQESNLVGTVGKISVFPNSTNIIPGLVEFTFEIRGSSDKQIQQVVEKIRENWVQICLERGIEIDEQVFLNQKPITFDAEVVSILQDTAEEIREEYITLPSMAIHDAAHMASVAKSAMIFVKSRDGRSHCPEEYSSPEDMEKAGNLMLHAIINLDQRLE